MCHLCQWYVLISVSRLREYLSQQCIQVSGNSSNSWHSVVYLSGSSVSWSVVSPLQQWSTEYPSQWLFPVNSEQIYHCMVVYLMMYFIHWCVFISRVLQSAVCPSQQCPGQQCVSFSGVSAVCGQINGYLLSRGLQSCVSDYTVSYSAGCPCQQCISVHGVSRSMVYPA